MIESLAKTDKLQGKAFVRIRLETLIINQK
jgi:hypothetical protein